MTDIASLPSMNALGKCRTLTELQRWARSTWGADGGSMSSPEDFARQARLAETELQVNGKRLRRTSVFIRLPETLTIHGGYETVIVVKAVLSWPDERVLCIIYDPL